MITSFCHQFAAALLLAAALPASAASFDCAKAGTNIEKAVCADPQLTVLDEKLAAAYRNAVAALGKLDIRPKQREWARKRAACSDEKISECLSQAYTGRIELLSKLAAAARDPARHLTLGAKDGPYNIEAIMTEDCCQARAFVFISRKSDHKMLLVLNEENLEVEPPDFAVRVEDYNQDGIKDVVLRRGIGFHGWAYFLSKPDGSLAENQVLAELESDANDGLELEPNGEVRVAHRDSPRDYYIANYKVVEGKPVLTRKETYRGDELVESWPRHKKKR